MATSFGGYHQPQTLEVPIYRKEIKFDRHSRDFAYYVNGEIKGYAANHHDAEVALNELVFDLLGGRELSR